MKWSKDEIHDFYKARAQEVGFVKRLEKLFK